jgi:hypothetical protein
MFEILGFFFLILLTVIPISVKLYFFKTTLEELEVETSYLWIIVSIIASIIGSAIIIYGITIILGLLGVLVGRGFIIVGAYLLGVGLGLYTYYYILKSLIGTHEYIVIVADIVSNIYSIVAVGILLLIVSMFIPTAPIGYESQYVEMLHQKPPWG